MADGVSPVPSGTLERAERVLACLEECGSLTLSQVASRTGLPVSTTHRLLERLVALRWLARNDRGYELGIRLFDLGSYPLRGHWFHHAALPVLRDLHRRTGLVVHLGFLDGAEVVYWERIAGAVGSRVPTRVGGRFPAHRCAVGKAMLTALAPEAVAARVGAVMPRLSAELDAARNDRVAFDRSESIRGLGCVAAPVDYPLPSPAAVSVCGPSSRVLPDRRLVLDVQQAVGDIVAAARKHDPALER